MRIIIICGLLIWAKSLATEPVSAQDTAMTMVAEAKDLLKSYVLDEQETIAIASLSAR